MKQDLLYLEKDTKRSKQLPNNVYSLFSPERFTLRPGEYKSYESWSYVTSKYYQKLHAAAIITKRRTSP